MTKTNKVSDSYYQPKEYQVRVLIFKEGDFVFYKGSLSVAAGPLREEGIDIIEHFEEFNRVKRIYLFLPTSNNHIWYSHDDID